MPSQLMIDFFNVYGGIMSITLGCLSVFLSAIFFVSGMRAEGRNKKVLAEIKTQTDILQQITSNHLGKLIDNSNSTINKLIDNNPRNDLDILKVEQLISEAENKRKTNE